MTPSCDTSYCVNFSLQLQVPLEINAIQRYCSILKMAPSMNQFRSLDCSWRGFQIDDVTIGSQPPLGDSFLQFERKFERLPDTLI